jgi:hypothetical protein
VTVVVGPAPHFGGPGGAPPILAAVPCQPLPLQPFEWFNPPFLPYVTAPCHNGLASARDRRKRYSTDSQVLHISSLLMRHKMAQYDKQTVDSVLFLGSILAHSETWIVLFSGRTDTLTQSCVKATNLHDSNEYG